MAHTKFEDLSDLHKELEKIRTLPGLKEKVPGIFYFKSIPFLHFHDKDGIRWADVKINGDWVRLEIDFSASAKEKASFLKRVKEAHQNII